jgi:hypothetical protein
VSSDAVLPPHQVPLLIRVLRNPHAAASLDVAGWDLLLRQAQGAHMDASLLLLLEQAGCLDAAPAAPRAQLEWARVVLLQHGRAVRFEVRKIGSALAGLGLPLILLKGAAYAMAGLAPGRGRIFSDIDILVPKERISDVEGTLRLHGWLSTISDAYDQRYYREWMHELPPMEHLNRGNVIDVHHAILPETAAQRPDPAKLRAHAVPVAGLDVACEVQVLAPRDMLLHSAVHLFSDGEFNHGLRDLFDIHRMLLEFGSQAGFWDGLVERAAELELTRPLFYALRYARRLLGTAVPPAVLRQADIGRPNAALLPLMDALFGPALMPLHPSCTTATTKAAHGALYLRGNWLRMPPLLLARHLFHKAFLSPRPAPAPEPNP